MRTIHFAIAAALPFALSAVSARGADPLAPAPQRFAAETGEEVPDFQRHVLPLLGRLGCNGRACHGSFQGQGGLRLSLFGYDFKADHDALATGDNPRTDTEVPAESLMLLKPTLGVPHKGGRRFELNGWEHRLLTRWIAGGAKPADEHGVRFERLDVQPTTIVFTKPGEKVQLRVVAHWENGVQEDVTPLCRYRSNNDSRATIDESGSVTSVGPGETHVVAFYDNGVVPVQTLLPVSDLVGPRYPEVPTPTEIDRLVVDQLKKLGMVPSELSTDAEFLRRLSLDMTGALPSAEEIEAFLADTSSDKRARKVDELLERPAYAASWSVRLCDITGNNPRTFAERNAGPRMGQQWYQWIERRVRENMPYDHLVTRIVLSSSRKPGQSYDDYIAEMATYFRKDDPADFSTQETMPHYWARRTFSKPDDRAMGFAYSFLGVRMQCAQCHKHPFDQWTQDDFKQFAAFFGRVSTGVQRDGADRMRALREENGKDKKNIALVVMKGEPYPWQEVFVVPPAANGRGNPDRKGKNDKEGKKPPKVTFAMTAKYLGGDDVAIGEMSDPRESLIAWLKDSSNPYFAKAFVNRVWAAYFGVGIIEPADDLNLANPPSNGPLLDWLANEFVAHGYDMKWLHRTIANSRTYQLSARTNDTNRTDDRNFSHAQLRRIPAEAAYSSVYQALASKEELTALNETPICRAIGMGGGLERKTGAGFKLDAYVLKLFGLPERATNCDCERSNEASLLQTIYLRNDQDVLTRIQQSRWLQELDRELNPRSPAQARSQELDKREFRRARANVAQLNAQLQKLHRKGNKEEIPEVEAKLKTALEDLKKLDEAGAVKVEATTATAPQVPEERLAALVRETYLRTLSRPPTDEESNRAKQHLHESANTMAGLHDLVWALLNTKEFIVNH